MSVPRRKGASSAVPSTNHTNGQDKAKRPRKGKAKAAELPPAPAPAAGTPPPAPPPERTPGTGRLLSAVARSAPTWFVDPLIPAGCLTLVVGDPSTGKSTFGAWLCSQAQRPVILPGNEEDVSCALLPRLLANGVDPQRCLVLDDRLWSLPTERRALTTLLRSHGADLLWMDPIDSYVGETPENDGPGVRAALEALCLIARDVGCAVAAARHPGKQPGNICPGSRQWRAVPREIVELLYDAGPPEQRVLRLRKDPYSRGDGPRAFALEGEPRQPKRFTLREGVSAELADSLGEGDAVDRWKIDEAMALLRAVLADGEQLARDCYKHAEDLRLPERTVRRAAARLGLQLRREGQGLNHRVYWALPS